MAVPLKFRNYLNKLTVFLKTYQLPLLSGLLSGTSYIPFPPWAAVFMWVPLWWFVSQQKSLKTILMGAWLCQFIVALVGFNWVAYTIHTFGQLPWVAAILGLLFFCAFSNIFIVVACAAWFFLVHRSPTSVSMPFRLILFPLLFSLFHSLIPMLFPWNMGYVWLWTGLPLFQTAEIWGARFLNTLIYIFNLCFLILYKHRWDSTGKGALAAAAGLFVFLNIFGFYLKHRLPDQHAHLTVLTVQTNIGQLTDLTGDLSHMSYFPPSLKKRIKKPARRARILTKELTYKGLIKFRRQYKERAHINFILWPEGGYPYIINKSQSHVPYLTRIVKKLKIPLITGGIGRDDRGHSNSLFIFNREGELLKPVYDKIKLLAFGEYMPGPFQLPFIKKLLPYFQGRFIPGQNPAVQELEGTLLGLQICYESLFDKITRKMAQEGAQALINVTNDSWYGSWQEPWQHLVMSLARAVEVRRPLIRATNTGISTVIQSDGTVMKQSPLNKPWIHLYEIPYDKNPPATLFMGWGFYINELFLLLLTLTGFLWPRLKKNLSS